MAEYSSDPSARAQQLVAEGKIGGARPGAGRPRRDRYSRLIAEAMEPHVDEVVAAIRAGLADSNTRTRVQAARAAVDLAVRHDLVAARDEHHEDALAAYEHLTQEELVDRLASHVQRLQLEHRHRLGEGDDERVIDGVAVEG